MTRPDDRSEVAGTRTFQVSAQAYDLFMGRYSRRLAPVFADAFLGASRGRFLDVGCGPGALTAVAVERFGPANVVAVDPSPGFVQACRDRHPGVEVRCAPAERLPFGDDGFDYAAAQLVFHFVSEPETAAAELARVVRPGGVVAAATWDFADGMQLLRAFWDAALTLDPGAPDEARVLRFGAPGELAALLAGAGLAGVAERTAAVSSTYQDFDELWRGFLAGIGPAGAYTAALDDPKRARLREELHQRLGLSLIHI